MGRAGIADGGVVVVLATRVTVMIINFYSWNYRLSVDFTINGRALGLLKIQIGCLLRPAEEEDCARKEGRRLGERLPTCQPDHDTDATALSSSSAIDESRYLLHAHPCITHGMKPFMVSLAPDYVPSLLLPLPHTHVQMMILHYHDGLRTETIISSGETARTKLT